MNEKLYTPPNLYKYLSWFLGLLVISMIGLMLSGFNIHTDTAEKLTKLETQIGQQNSVLQQMQTAQLTLTSAISVLESNEARDQQRMDDHWGTDGYLSTFSKPRQK